MAAAQDSGRAAAAHLPSASQLRVKQVRSGRRQPARAAATTAAIARGALGACAGFVRGVQFRHHLLDEQPPLRTVLLARGQLRRQARDALLAARRREAAAAAALAQPRCCAPAASLAARRGRGCGCRARAHLRGAPALLRRQSHALLLRAAASRFARARARAASFWPLCGSRFGASASATAAATANAAPCRCRWRRRAHAREGARGIAEHRAATLARLLLPFALLALLSTTASTAAPAGAARARARAAAGGPGGRAGGARGEAVLLADRRVIPARGGRSADVCAVGLA